MKLGTWDADILETIQVFEAARIRLDSALKRNSPTKLDPTIDVTEFIQEVETNIVTWNEGYQIREQERRKKKQEEQDYVDGIGPEPDFSFLRVRNIEELRALLDKDYEDYKAACP